MKIAAFDPGRIASYARLDTCRPFDIEIGEITLIGTGRLLRPCPLHIAEIIRDVDCCIVEEVGGRTGQGVSGVFTFCLCDGTMLGAV